MAFRQSNGVSDEGPFRSFMKIILQPNNLILPRRFVRKYGDELGEIAQLTVSDGRVWRMEIERGEEGNQVWFGKGFSEFVKHYSIHYGHCLRFQYNNHSNFSVNIYDKSACEIIYPSNIHSANTRKTNFNQGESSKKSRKSEPKKAQVEEEEEEEEEEIILSKKTKSTLQSKEITGMTKAAMEQAINSKPRNPSFLIIILKSSIRNNLIPIPTEFGCKYMKDVHNDVKVELRDGRKKWLVRYSSCWKDESMRLCGCDRFYRDNCSKQGDVCLLELVQKKPSVVLKVSIFAI